MPDEALGDDPVAALIVPIGNGELVCPERLPDRNLPRRHTWTRTVCTSWSAAYRQAPRRGAGTFFVDGDHAGDIGPGEQLAFPASEGLHRVQARIDWTGSPGVDVVVAPESTPRLVVRPAGSSAMGLFQIFGRTSYLKLEQH